jgi:8-oxo-dGTP pyrophosphatase MutT (NUDIX family)
MLLQATTFPQSFQCYKPFYHKVYGSICISAANRILLVKGRRTGKWSFPKGHKQRWEGFLDCAKRETMEETGIDLGDKKYIACHKMSVGEYYFFEVDEEMEPSIKDVEEVEEAAWKSMEEIGDLECNIDVSHFLNRMKRGGKPLGSGGYSE